MKATNSIVNTEKKQTFSGLITTESMQKMLTKSLGNANAAARMTSILISAVASSYKLQQCLPQTIISSALHGEGMGLVFGQGYYIVPYGNRARCILGYKAYIQLCISTGFYADIDCIDVREGEVTGKNARTGKPIVNLAIYENDEERKKHPIVGYKAYFELKDGFYREEYWTIQDILKHADRYSPSFNLEKYEKLINNKLSEDEKKKVLEGSPWYDVDGNQYKMCKKTVLKSLLSSGYAPMSNEIKNIIINDEENNILYESDVIIDDKENSLEATPSNNETETQGPKKEQNELTEFFN